MSRALPFASATGDVQALAGPATLMGVVAAVAVASVVRLRDGTSTSDPVKAVIGIPAGGTGSAMLPAVEFATGVFIDRDTNASELVLYVL